jgi:hypothetical protein
MEEQYYGDEQAMYTMNRAAYGDVPAALISGGGTRPAGAMYGLRNMMSDIGSRVMPVTYSHPARFVGGQYGEYNYNTGFMKSVGISTGLVGVPRGAMASEYTHAAAGDTGERVGTGMVGAAAAIASIPLTAMLAPMTAFAGKAVGAAAGSAVGSVLGGTGAVVGGGIGGAVGGVLGGVVAPFMMAAAAGQAVTQAVGERRTIQNYLDQTSFRWAGAGSAFADPVKGGGVAPKAGREISEYIRDIDVKDKMVDTADLTNVLRHGTQMGLFTGTRDMEDFKKRFKDITESVKSVTKLLHQTLEEGMKTIADLKAVGIDPSKAKDVVSQAASLGATAGRTAQEMVGIGLQGAEMFRGTGVQMGIGFQAAQMNTAAIRASRDAGLLSQEAIVQAGGEESLAMKMTAGGLAFGQSAQGRGFAAAFFQPGTGLNQAAFMQNTMMGGGNFIQNVQNAAQNLGNPARLIEFQANQEKIMTDMGKKFGGRGLEMAMLGSTAAFAEYMAGQTGASKEDSFRLALKQQGKSTSEIDAYMAQIRDPDKVFKALQEGVESTTNKRKIDEASENFVLNRLGSAVGDWAKKTVIDPVARPLNAMVDDVKEGVRTFTEEQIYGVQRGTSKGVDLAVKFETTDVERKNIRSKLGATDLSQGGLFATTAGQSIARALAETPGLANLTGMHATTVSGDAQLKAGDVKLMDERVLGIKVGTTSIEREKFIEGQQKARVLSMTTEEAAEFEKAGKLKDVKGKSLVDIFASGKASTIRSTEDLLKVMFDTNKPTEEQMAYALMETKGTSLEKVIGETRKGAQKIIEGADNDLVMQLKNARGMFDEGKQQLEKRGDIKLADGVSELLAKANEANNKNDPASERDFLSKAKALQARKTGEDISSIDKKLEKAYAGNQMALENIKTGAIAIADIQAERGSSVISRSIQETLYTEQGVKLGEDVKQQVRSAADILGRGDVAGISKLTKDSAMMGALKKTDAGTAIAQQLEDISSIEKLSPKAEDKDIRESLKKVFKDERQVTSAMAMYKEGGKESVISEAIKSFQMNMTTAGGMVAASGTATTAEGGGGLQTASQTAAVQTSMNMQTLMAMEALARKLGVK